MRPLRARTEVHRYRNGYARPRDIGIGTWWVPVRAPRVSDTPPDAPPFES